MIDFKNGKKYIIGLVHLLPLPGTPFYEDGSLDRIIEKAVADANALVRGGADGCLIQTVDRAYSNGDDADYARVSAITLVTQAVKKAVPESFLVGVQLMWNCITPSIAVAKVCGADFVRCTALVGTCDSPYGTVEAQPLKVQEYRRKLNAMDVTLIAEIQGYHFKGDGDQIKELCSRAYFATYAGADAVEIVDKDEEKNNAMAKALKGMGVPVVLGGSTNAENVARRMQHADMALVGSCFEKKGWGGAIDEEAVRTYMESFRKGAENK